MHYGASFPVGDWGNVIALRDFAQAMDAGGMDYVSLTTHLLAMPPGSLPNERPTTTSVRTESPMPCLPISPASLGMSAFAPPC